MRVPTLGGLKTTISSLKSRSYDTSQVESRLKTHGDSFQWTDDTLIKDARSDLKNEAADKFSSGASFLIGGGAAALIGGGLAALTIGTASLAFPLAGVALATGGLALLAKGGKDVGQGMALSDASKELSAYADRQNPLPQIPQGSKDDVKAAQVVRAVKKNASRALSRLDSRRHSDLSSFEIKDEKKTQGVLSPLCTASFSATGKTENHELTEFDGRIDDKGQYKNYSLKKVEGGTLYTYSANGTGPQRALENQNGTITLVP